MAAPRLTRQQKHAIIDAYLAGEKCEQIASRFGVHYTYPSILVRRYGRPRRSNKRVVPESAHPIIAELFVRRVPRNLIAKIWGIKRRQVERIANAEIARTRLAMEAAHA